MFDLQFFDVGPLDLRMDFEGMTLQDENQNLSRKSSLRRSNSCSTRPSQCNRSHRKLCRQKAVYARPSIQSYSPHSSTESINEEKFLDKQNLEDLDVTNEKGPSSVQSGRLKSASLNSSFTYRAITPVVESALE
jgi:hypothetical protein